MAQTADTEKGKRNLHRSPSYPLFSLEVAIEKAKGIYDNDRRSATSADVVASHMGYRAAKGLGGRAVSALRQYGLLEENAGKYRISELGYTLVHFAHDSMEWLAAVADAATRPTLFRELLDQYPEGLPSDATLRNDLLKRGFNPSAISEVIAVLRDSLSLAKRGGMIHNGGGAESLMPATQIQPDTTQSQLGTHPGSPQDTPRTSARPGTRQDVFSLVEGPVTIQWPAVISAESYQDLADWLDILKRKISRSVNKDE